jgi:hypothetical protein
MSRRNLAVIGIVLVTALTACNREDAVLSTTSTLVTGPDQTTTAPPGTTTLPDTSTTLRGQAVASFEILARLSTDNGDVLHVVIPVGAYTDVDLESFIGDLKESDPELWGAEVFDDPTAPAAFTVDEAGRTPEQQELLDRHHLVSLVEGDTIRFQGPFESFGEVVIGS